MFTYPRLSIVWACMLISFVWLFDPKYLLSYAAILLIIVFGRGHEAIYSFTEPFM